MTEAARRAAQDVTVVDLRRDFDRRAFDALYSEVLAPTFAPEELDSPEAISAGLEAGRTAQTWVALRGDAVLGGLVAERYGEVLLVGYLAVRPDLRGRGIGTALMSRLRAHCDADPGVRLALGEVHDPRRHPDARDRALDRLRFFERQGARLLDVPFVQPALRPGGARVPGFLLLAFHVGPAPGARAGVPAAMVSRFVRDYYEATENATPPFDAELEALLARVERDGVVALRPVADYARVAA